MTTVLFVDDDPMILKCINRSLRAEPYKKIYVDNGEEALEVLSEQMINVIVTDVGMPGMNGLELLNTVKVLYPQIECIVLSGNIQINQADSFKVLEKPWDLEDELKPAIRKAIADAKS